jgi:hypothetical protein
MLLDNKRVVVRDPVLTLDQLAVFTVREKLMTALTLVSH